MTFAPYLGTVFRLLGTAGTYAPPGGGAAVPVAVKRVGGGAPVQIGPVTVVIERTSFHVQRAELALPSAGGVVTIPAGVWTVEAVEPVERDTEGLLWGLHCAWGELVTYRPAADAGDQEHPPRGSSFMLAADAPAGAAVVSIKGTLAAGRLLPGDSFDLAEHPAPYSVAAPVVAVGGTFGAVALSSPLAAPAVAGAAVAFTFGGGGGVRVHAAMVELEPSELAGGTVVGSRRMVVLRDALTGAGVTGDPKAGDRVIAANGRRWDVASVRGHTAGGTVRAWELLLK